MKSILGLAILLALSAFSTAPASSFSDASGIHEACIAGTLLDANRVSYRVVVFHSDTRDEAGCVYRSNGVNYLYTPLGSARINPAELGQVPLETVPRSEVFRIADGDRDIRNGCLVYATCAYAEYKRDPHIRWAGIIAARVVNINNFGDDGSGQLGLTGHAITAFETDKRQIFIQENGEKPKMLEDMTEKAQAGDTSWHDSSALIYCDHHIQGITVFNCEFGRPS